MYGKSRLDAICCLWMGLYWPGVVSPKTQRLVNIRQFISKLRVGAPITTNHSTYLSERLPDEADDGSGHDVYSSVLVHQDQTSSSARYNLVYRPPCLNARLIPGEAKPRFWVNPYVPPQGAAAVVSVAWGKSSQPSYCQYFTHSTNSKRNSKHASFMNACIKGGEVEPKNVDSEILGAKPTLGCGDNNLNIKTYPDFLLPFINNVVRLRLVCLDSMMSQLVGAFGHLKQGMHSDPSAEMSHLIRNVHWLRVYLTYSRDVSGLPEVSVEEHHGGIKRLKMIRYRTMPVSWIDMDHRKPAIKIIGDSFVLSLEPPPPSLRLEDFPEGNGEPPSAVGIYSRHLDTAADTEIRFSARIFGRYNQTVLEHQRLLNDINVSQCLDDKLHP